MTDKFLNKVYDKDGSDVRDLYAQWSDSYDAEISENGYATPMRAAVALAQHCTDRDVAVLDFGCGTGLSGLALAAQGFGMIDGIDVTPEMVARAQGKGVYRSLQSYGLDDPLPVSLSEYGAIAAIGVISPGAAPPAVLDQIVRGLRRGAFFTFSFNGHALADASYPEAVQRHVATGTVAKVFEEHGDHLPGIGLKSTVYVLEKL